MSVAVLCQFYRLERFCCHYPEKALVFSLFLLKNAILSYNLSIFASIFMRACAIR